MVDDRHQRVQNQTNAVNWSIECVRLGILVNGGAIIAILAFQPHNSVGLQSELKFAITVYIFGVFAAFAAAATAYLAQRISAEARDALRRWFFPGLNGVGAGLIAMSFSLFASGTLYVSEDIFPDDAALAAAARAADAHPGWDASNDPPLGF